jgi:hypothetical protein
MLLSASRIKGLKLHAIDGELGKVLDVLFDDHTWTVRYFVVRASGWLENRQVLISPASVGRPSWDDRVLPVKLTQDQIRNSPDIDTEKPVSRQREIDLVNYYGWPAYWEVPFTGAGPIAVPTARPYSAPKEQEVPEPDETAYDPHLRSLMEVRDYRIHAQDGDIGHLDDLLIDDASWTIHYVVVNTRNWLPGRFVLVSPLWSHDIDWRTRKIAVDVLKHALKSAPLYDPNVPITREFEQETFEHYRKERAQTAAATL